ncbi:MAG TPA: amidohydrolase family protein, partial [Polymorphobacter sp.]|nr:amidohydrolase family protein [Polymorphobacter sp.]
MSMRKWGMLLGAMLVAVAPAGAETVAVSGARMIDVIGGTVVANPVIVITDGRITAAGSGASVAVPAGARRIDLPGMTLLPGLIDMHVHLTSDPTVSGYKALEFTDSYAMAVGVASARRTLDAGFTTVR